MELWKQPQGLIVPLPACPMLQGCLLSPLYSRKCGVRSKTLPQGL